MCRKKSEEDRSETIGRADNEDHDHGHHDHGHGHHGRRRPEGGDEAASRPPAAIAPGLKVLNIRVVSGLAGDMMLCGLARMGGLARTDLDSLVDELKLPALKGCVSIERKQYNNIGGWSCAVDLPPEHAHRTYADIAGLIEKSDMKPEARAYALTAFRLLAEAEGEVHGRPLDKVTFHEVGALDSILDLCLACSLFVRIAPDHFVCSPLPMADGSISCAHGVIPAPAPAVLKLLDGVAVREFAGSGETVTPTAIALLKALGARFGAWPRMVVEKTALVYGGKFFPDAANGSIWSLGRSY